MAHVEWSAGIDSVSGALAKPGSNPQHSCEKMLLGTHRVAPTENPNCNRLYLRKKSVVSFAERSCTLHCCTRGSGAPQDGSPEDYAGQGCVRGSEEHRRR